MGSQATARSYREDDVGKEPKVRRNASNPGNMGKGRVKGVPNKTTALLKDAILQAASAAGGDGGLVGYLTLQAIENPGPFMSLLGKVMPMQVEGTGKDGAITFTIRDMTKNV